MRETGDANADGKMGLLGFRFEEFANAASDQSSGSHAGFRKDHGEFVAAMARGGIGVAAGILEDLRESAESAIAGEMTELIVNLF